MQHKFLSMKLLADQAIAAGSLDAFFHEALLHIVMHRPAMRNTDTEQVFFKFASVILKERYHLFIDEYLKLPGIELPPVSQAIINDMDSIDLFFEKYYNLLKARYITTDAANAGFFRQYHRRDLKQDSMLRAFIIVRNRLLNQSFKDEKAGMTIAFFADELTGAETCKASVKSFLTLEGMQKYVVSDTQCRSDMMQEINQFKQDNLTQEFLENLSVESLPANENHPLKMIEINKDSFRIIEQEYLSQYSCMLG